LFFQKKPQTNEEEYTNFELFYNPDPLVNRMNLVLRLTREMELSEDEVSKNVLYDCIKLTMKSMNREEEDADVSPIPH